MATNAIVLSLKLNTFVDEVSRNPLDWSREGLCKMAMFRIFAENDGKVTAEHIRVSRSKKGT
ncbi:MAG: hypothetical protein II897_08720 [Clostridia bacterium]|nr:hypothetical protein [Clostridia bacterium]